MWAIERMDTDSFRIAERREQEIILAVEGTEQNPIMEGDKRWQESLSLEKKMSG